MPVVTTRQLICVAAFSFVIAPNLAAESPNWSHFHGADGLGFAADGSVPLKWTDSDYSWRREFDSRDVGSPIVIDDKVYVLASKPKEMKIVLESLDLSTGKLRWSKQYDQQSYHLHVRNTLASSTPAADLDHVYVAWADPDHTYLKCFDHDGKEIWSRDFGSWQSQHGFGTSPRVIGDAVLLLNSQQAEQLRPGATAGNSRVIAVDRKTGETLWQTPLKTTKSCYGVPTVYGQGDEAQIIAANTGNGMFGINPRTGRLLWELDVFEMRCCSTPIIAGDLAIGASGSGGGGNHLVAVRIPKNEHEKPQQVYRIDRNAPYVPTPVLKGDRLFMVDDRGIASCVNVKTGESIRSKRIGGNYGASPIVVGDTMLVISLDGKVTLLRADDDLDELGKVDLGGPVGATPAFASGRLLLRVDKELRCLGGPSI